MASVLSGRPRRWIRRPSLLAVAAASLVLAAPAHAGVVLGDQQIEPTPDSNVPGMAEAFRATATSSGTLARLTVYVDASSTATTLVSGVYADNNGHPGTLLGQGSLSSLLNGAWNDVRLPAIDVTAGTAYWIALLGPTGMLGFRDSGNTGGASETGITASLTTLPATWATGTVYAGSPVSAYASTDSFNQPILSVAPASLSFSAVEGGSDPSPATLSVGNAGTGSISFTASADVSWLSVSPASGTAPQTVRVSAALAGLAAGSYSGQVTIAAPGAQGSPAAVPVTLTVASGATQGVWSAPVGWPLVAVHSVLQPNGQVLMWDGWDAGVNSERLWDPSSGTFVPVPYSQNLFCAGHIILGDGRTVVLGGHIRPYVGLPDATVFDPTTNTWTRGADMSVSRWYPTGTTLADGRVLVVSGDSITQNDTTQPHYLIDSSNTLPEIYDPVKNAWTDFPNGRQVIPLYPHMFVLPDGRVFDAGPDPQTRIFDPATGAWTPSALSPIDGHSAVMYRPGKILQAGAFADPDIRPVYATSARAAVIDMNQPAPAWREVAPMANPRAYLDLTALPDGTVLATGGQRTSDGVDLGQGALAAELWDPTTETWTTMSSMRVPRLYHSTALLLPDGRVLVAGGGAFPTGGATNEPNAEIFSPPYLFKGARPRITSAPATALYGSSFSVSTPDAASIASVSLVRLGAVTHAFDQNQRFVPLSFTQAPGGLSVQAPANSNLAPPGFYMLFLVDSKGVPSIASFVRLPSPWENLQAVGAPTGLTATGSAGAVALSWNPSGSPGVAHYNVYRSSSPSVAPTPVEWIGQTSGAGTTYRDAGLAPGTYYYVVTAVDASANESPASNSASAVVPDTTPPTVSITAPGPGAVVSGTVTVAASAADNVRVAGVQFKLDGANLGAEATSPPYSVPWDTTTAANGTHALSAVARDAAGNQTTASSVTVTVQNVGPGPAVLLGDQQVEAGLDSNPPGQAEAFVTTATASGTLSGLSVYVDASSTATSLVVGLYSAGGGHPGALLAQAILATPVAGSWNTVSLPATPVSAGVDYWIALLGPSGTVRFRDRASGMAAAETSASTSLTTLPASWTTGIVYRDAPLSAYGG